MGNRCIPEITGRKTCFTACASDRCNSGSGYDPDRPSDHRDPDTGVEGDRDNTARDDDDDEEEEEVERERNEIFNRNRDEARRRSYARRNAASDFHFSCSRFLQWFSLSSFVIKLNVL